MELGSQPLAEAQWGVSYDKGTVGPADPPPRTVTSRPPELQRQDQSFTKSPEAVFTQQLTGDPVISLPGLGPWDLHGGAPVLKAENGYQQQLDTNCTQL